MKTTMRKMSGKRMKNHGSSYFYAKGDKMTKMLINLMKCPKHGWFHGGMTGWVCPDCKKEKGQSSASTMIKEEK